LKITDNAEGTEGVCFINLMASRVIQQNELIHNEKQTDKIDYFPVQKSHA